MTDGAFESKLHARRETRDGIFLTLLIHPDDYSAELAMVRVGAALQVGWAEILDVSVQTLEQMGRLVEQSPAPQAPKPKRAFKDLSLPEQAGIRCADPEFQQFLLTKYPKSARFEIETIPDLRAAIAVRALCGVDSRADFSTNHTAANYWRVLEASYQSWLTDVKYAEVRR